MAEKVHPYKSCNCKYCRRLPPSRVRGEAKREAHRKYRHDWKAAIHHGRTDDESPALSTGYKY